MKIAKLVSHKEGVVMQAEYKVNDSQIEGFLKFGGINVIKFEISKDIKRIIPTTGFINFGEPTKNTMNAVISEIANIELGTKFGYNSSLLNTYYIQTSLDI